MPRETTCTTTRTPYHPYRPAESLEDRWNAERLADEWCRCFQAERPSMRLRLEEWQTIRAGLVSAALHDRRPALCGATSVLDRHDCGPCALPLGHEGAHADGPGPHDRAWVR
jgi:hypothetical protein